MLTEARARASPRSRRRSKLAKPFEDLDEVGSASERGRVTDEFSEATSQVPARSGPARTRSLAGVADLEPQLGATHLGKESWAPMVMDDYRLLAGPELALGAQWRLPGQP